MKVWIIVATACRSCGGDTAVRLLTAKPTDGQIEETSSSIGGMFCIHTNVVEIEQDGEIIIAGGN